MTPNGWVVYFLLQSTLEMRYAFCAAPEAHFFAEIVSPLSADATLTTRDANF
jgi:hypothetical protein